MKLFVVSDIHGYATELKTALNDAGYDSRNENHLLICCGDFFDRGTENTAVLKFFERLSRVVMIKGNHDARLLEIMETGRLGGHDVMNGTVETVLEFFGARAIVNLFDPIDFSGKTSTFRRLTDFIGEMRNYFETEHYIFVHGWLPNDGKAVMPDWRHAPEQAWYNSRWTHWTDGCEMPGNQESKTIICGHYPTPRGKIYCGDGFTAIDAGCANRGWINVLVLEDDLQSAGN